MCEIIIEVKNGVVVSVMSCSCRVVCQVLDHDMCESDTARYNQLLAEKEMLEYDIL